MDMYNDLWVGMKAPEVPLQPFLRLTHVPPERIAPCTGVNWDESQVVLDETHEDLCPTLIVRHIPRLGLEAEGAPHPCVFAAFANVEELPMSCFVDEEFDWLLLSGSTLVKGVSTSSAIKIGTLTAGFVDPSLVAVHQGSR